MAQLFPFRAYRYDPEAVGEITNVVAPPYDRIDPAVQRACHERSPYNIARITKGIVEAGDDDTHNVYTRAAEYLERWIDEGILVRDAQPALYAYHQTYTFGGERLTRKGVIGLGKLEPEKVHAHERTLRGPREDRLKLLRATEANFGHIFMLYSDPERVADAAVELSIAERPPEITATDADGNEHSVWRVSDPEAISAVQTSLGGKDLYIADGHHRYETAVNYMRECVEKGWRPAAPESFDVRMMTLFNIDEPGMSIRPIHRLVHGLTDFDEEGFYERAAETFLVDRFSSFGPLTDAMALGGKHTFGVASRETFALLRLRDDADLRALVPGDVSDDFVELDVAILHAAIFDRLLGIDAQALEEQRNVTYTVDVERGLGAVASGEEQSLFLLHPTGADEVVRVANHGEKMPQKSTDFYPKLLTGLVLSKMEIEKGA